jgi:hypothetical protein
VAAARYTVDNDHVRDDLRNMPARQIEPHGRLRT